VPASILVTITALSVILGLNCALGILALTQDPTAIVRVAVSMGLGALLLLGMIFGQRLAWQWGRILGILAAVLMTIGAVVGFFSTRAAQVPSWVSVLSGSILLVQAACLYTIFFALGQRSAKLHFGLKCPVCGELTNKAADFFFNRAKCKGCGNVW
jgi:hypothetical protein